LHRVGRAQRLREPVLHAAPYRHRGRRGVPRPARGGADEACERRCSGPAAGRRALLPPAPPAPGARAGGHPRGRLIERAVAAKATYTDNLNIRPGVRDPQEIFTFSPSARASSRTESRNLGAELRLDAYRYPGRPQLNTVGYAGSASGSWMSELDTF